MSSLEEKIHPKIISLAPSITEILFSLGLEKNIVGITTFCDYPEQTQNIEKVANFSGQANIERILSLKPDFIFSTGLEQAPLVDKLKRLKLKVILVYPQNLQELFSSILELGRLTGKEENAHNLVDQMEQRIKTIKERVQAIPNEQKPKVFVEISPDPFMTAGKGSFVNELIELAGGKNIAYDTKRAYSQFSPEVVIERNPDFILLGYMQPQPVTHVRQRMGWRHINAVKNRQIITDINPDLFLRPGPRIVNGLEQIHARFFPK
jgi:iron complex transport system substrate-binding protein